MTQTLDRIRAKISEGALLLGPQLRSWVEDHLILPREVRLATDVDGTSFKKFWLITDHVGTNDSSYRIIFDEETDSFGLECTLDSGVEWCMGNYGSFDEVVENM